MSLVGVIIDRFSVGLRQTDVDHQLVDLDWLGIVSCGRAYETDRSLTQTIDRF